MVRDEKAKRSLAKEKGMIHFADAEIAAIITGTEVPGVLISRTDSDIIKFNSIALAVYYSAKRAKKTKK